MAVTNKHSSASKPLETATFQSSTLAGDCPNPLRRQLLKTSIALPLFSILGNLNACTGGTNKVIKEIAGYEPSLQPDKSTLQTWLQQLHDFGPIRATGTKPCREFEEWLVTQFTQLGFSIERDQFRLTSWECDLNDCAISITKEDSNPENIEVIAYYPFAASTMDSGPVSGTLRYAGVGEPDVEKFIAASDPALLAEAIVIVDMPLADGGIRGTPQYYPGDAFPDPFQDRVSLAPRPASQGGRSEMALLEDKCRGIIFCYTDVSDEAARYNYLPFSDQHRKIPALWVGKETAAYLKTLAGTASATLTCNAKLTPNARADSLVATLPGSSSEEVIFLTTHTDGPNEVNDNGALGLLALATYYSKLPPEKRRRRLVCSLPTGHYAGGAIRDPETGSGESAGTRGVMAKRPEVIEKTVAQIAMEQMAALDWIELDGEWKWSGLPAREMWLPTPESVPTINQMLMACTEGEDSQFSRTTIVESGYAPGEGGSLRRAAIPGIGLMGSPEYFFRADPEGVLKYLSADVMHNQVSILTKLLVLMERLPVEKLAGEISLTEEDLFSS